MCDWISDVWSSVLSLQLDLSICSRLALFQGLGAPVLFGASRKRMIGALSNEAPVGARLGGSVALAFHAVQMGAQMVRVHDVKETVQAVHLWRGTGSEARRVGTESASTGRSRRSPES